MAAPSEPRNHPAPALDLTKLAKHQWWKMEDAKSNQMGSSHDAARPDTYTLPSAPYPRPEIIDISAMPGATQRSDRSNQS